MKKHTIYVVFCAFTVWIAALGYTEYTERKPWSAERGSVHLASCNGTHDECVLEGRIHRGWNSDIYVLTTPEGAKHQFTWDDISSMSHPVPGPASSK